uniref:Reverse transcriptase domain-containing protein n=1 Tax=Tanacetum cinerariifolium TaxID=118510 RepID=A0A699HXM6_TANCI|nr:reverse transcriptase domain-containing protein [Tanacetum cinerariifolium]
MLRACPHPGFSKLTQIDTFYNGLNEQDRDSLNAAMGGNLLSKTTIEALIKIENKPRVRYSRSKSNVSRVNMNSRDSSSKTDDRIDKLTDQILNFVEIVHKQVITPASAKAVEKTCVICGGTFLGNTMPNPKDEMKAITTRSGLAYKGPPIPTNSPLEKKKLSLPELTPTRMTLELADRSITHPKGVAEDVFIKVGKFHFPTDFVVVDFEADSIVSLILGRSFLRTDRALIDAYGEEITLRVNDESETFNLNQTMRYLSTYDANSYNSKSSNPTLVSNPSFSEETESDSFKKPIVKSSSPTLTPFGESDFFLEEIEDFLNNELISTGIENSFYDPEGDILYLEKLLNEDPFQLLLMDLKRAKKTKAKSSIEEPPELELKDPWVSPIDCVPKKGGINVLANENNKLISTMLVTGWRVCIDYKKLNDATRKDHFLLHFMDQILKRLTVNKFYCFLDGFLGYFQIPIDPQDQEKTTFTCPYGTFAYRRMPLACVMLPESLKLIGQDLSPSPRFPYGTVELSQPDGPNFKVNGHRVKHYFGGDIPSKVVPDLHTIPIDK